MTSVSEPLVFHLESIPDVLQAPNVEAGDGRSRLLNRVSAHALMGMQKEAVISFGERGEAWRMLCDEGPYLNGTDLAPPPLAFFSAGLAANFASDILAAAQLKKKDLQGFEIDQDVFYTMDGSAIRGTMTGGALPVELKVRANLIPAELLAGLVNDAVQNSLGEYLMRHAFTGHFSIICNGIKIDTGRVASSDESPPANPHGLLKSIRPDASCTDSRHTYAEDIISKLRSGDLQSDPAQGAGSSMKESQKRMLHLRTNLTLLEDGLKRIQVQLIKPTGSVFQFLSDDSTAFGGQGRAPSGLAYLSAGIAFCFMTQIGRYANIVRKDLSSYAIIQDMEFDLKRRSIRPIETHSYIDSSENDETVQKFIDMSEQTCFLHAACRLSNKSRVQYFAKE